MQKNQINDSTVRSIEARGVDKAPLISYIKNGERSDYNIISLNSIWKDRNAYF